MSVYAEAGAWLSSMRRSAEITQQELAEMLLVDQDELAKAETGVLAIDDRALARAARVFRLEANQLKQDYRAHLDLTKAAA